MKKLFTLFLIIFGTACLYAQSTSTSALNSSAGKKHFVGEYMVKDGIPGIVIYVDQSGEHGLVMSEPGIHENKKGKLENLAKKKSVGDLGKDNKWITKLIPLYNEGKIPYIPSPKKVDKKLKNKYISDLLSKFNDSGKHNTKIIKDYCAKNNIDMSVFFPEQYWTTQLGDGTWYMAGNKELSYYADLIGLGEGYDKYYKGIQYKQLQNKWKEVQESLSQQAGDVVGMPTAVLSSTYISINPKLYAQFKLMHAINAKTMIMFYTLWDGTSDYFSRQGHKGKVTLWYGLMADDEIPVCAVSEF